jgi:outer membrane protein assembly factor BamA
MRLVSVALVFSLASGLAVAQTKPRPRKAAKSTPVAKTTAPPPAAAAGAPWPIETLAVQGNQFYKRDQILAVAGLRVGQIAGQPEFEAARDRLVSTGAFDNVGYRFAPAKDNKGYDATIEVAEMQQLYPLRFEDLPVDDAEIRAWLEKKDPLFGEKIPATKREVDRYVHLIAEFLASHDYHDPIIGKVANGTNDLIVVFRPAKPRPNVTRVTFTNTGDLPSGLLQTKMYGVAIGMPYVEQQFRTLLDSTIRPLYDARGLIRVAFPKIETAPSKDADGVDVTVQVEQGPVYKLTHVGFAGAEPPREPFASLAKLKTDQPANFDDVKAAQARIAESFRRNGYIQASSTVQRDINDAAHTVDIMIQMTPGPLFTQGKLEIVGLDLVSEPVIRKMWGLAPGKPFNTEYPDHFLDRVKQDGIFDNLKKTRSETKVNADDHTVDVTLYFNK